MRQVKIFFNTDRQFLEKEINDWLYDHYKKISQVTISITSNTCMTGATLTTVLIEFETLT